MVLGTNIPELTVTDLAASLKRTLEDNFEHVRVRGELSRVTIASSGHLYSDLKDQGAVINVICWRTQLTRLGIKPEEGLEVICTGKITTYPARSNYQLVIERMELAGQGALLKMLEDRRKKLAAEGLFDQTRKRILPFLPKVIGVVTSPTGAVIQDILHRLSDRFPRHVLVWPVRVQGAGAENEIAAAIKGFNALPENGDIPRPDLIIVARGGGSLEDLMPFNEEIVVRAAADSAMPLISAVGHETDTTLIDYASDLRAPTPSAAAEKAVPVRDDLRAQIDDNATRLLASLRRTLKDRQKDTEALVARLGKPMDLVMLKTQALDQASMRLDHTFSQTVAKQNTKIIEAGARLIHPSRLIKDLGKHLEKAAAQLKDTSTRLLAKPKDILAAQSRMLESLSFERVLERGFAVVRSPVGTILQTAEAASLEAHLDIQFKAGRKIRVRPEKA